MIRDQKGGVLLFSVLMIGLAAIAMMATLATAGINSFVDADQQVSATIVRTDLFGCVDELLLQLNEDPDVSPVSVSIPSATCSVALVNEGGDNRSADLSLTQGSITRSVHIEMIVNGVQLTSVREE